MTVTINTLGTNSRQIVIDSETSATNIIAAVDTSLVALGWTLFDTVTSGSRGLLTTKVYSAVNADTVTTKYMIIRYDLQRQYWVTSCAESWNAITHVATNESWYGGRQILLPLQYSNTVLYVFATARYACFMGVVANEPGPWQGVFEFERYAAEDIAAPTIPSFGWTSSLTIGEPYGNTSTITASAPLNTATSANNGYVAVGFAPPRTKNGLTGYAAAAVFNLLTALGAFPPTRSESVDWSTGGITQTLNSHTAMLGTFGDSSSYVWDANKVAISNLQLNGYNALYLVGRIYGLKVTGKLGNVLDTTVVPVDANLFYSAAGSNTTHYCMGMHGGYLDKLSAGATKMVGTPTTSVTSLGVMWQSVLVSGRYLYFTTTTGFHKFDVQTQTFTYNILPAAQYYQVKFDGGNNLYVAGATANTVYKINLSNDTNTTLSMTGAWSGLAIDDDNLYVASNAAAATVTVKRVALSTFTEAASYTVTTGNATNTVTHMSCGDYAGYLYVGTLTNATASSNRITRIDRSNGNQVALTPTQSRSGAVGGLQPLCFDGANLIFFSGSSTAGGNSMITQQVRLSDFTMVTESVQSDPAVGSGSTGNVAGPTMGSVEFASYAGYLLFVRDGTNKANRIVISDPRTGPLIIISAISPVLDSTYISYGQPATDQCNYYTITNANIVVRYTNTFRTYNFNGVQTSNILIAQ